MNASSFYKIFLFGLTLIFYFAPLLIYGQFPFTRYDSVKVMEGQSYLDFPWVGGLNSCQFSRLDLSMDGIKDLLVFDREGNNIHTFLNIGTPGEVDLVYRPQYAKAFPELKSWVLLVDYNCDGKEDIFTSNVIGLSDVVAVYQNVSDTSLKFELVTEQIGYDSSNSLQVSSFDLPAIADIDNDGDYDILSFDISGSGVWYYQNLSMENYGTCDSLLFTLQDQCWGNFAEDSKSNNVSLGVNCRQGSAGNEGIRHHAGSALLALDLDGDQDKELILGDLTFNNLVMLPNGGSLNTANMTDQDTTFPAYDKPVSIRIFPAAFNIDVNNDGKKDLLVSPNERVGANNFTGNWFYQNTGSDSVPVFSFVQNAFLQDEMIETGAGANPAFFDYNADGLPDMVIGNHRYIENKAGETAGLALYENTGTQSKPEFKLITRDYLNLSNENIQGLYPAFGDLDNDGDTDLLVGESQGKLFYYENKAGAGQPANFATPVPQYKGIDIGAFAAPCIADLNKDGKPDLVIGERLGFLNYFQNKGTATDPDFNVDPDIEKFGGINVQTKSLNGNSTPFIFQGDDGKPVMLLGSYEGVFYIYGGIEEDLYGSFTLIDSLQPGGTRLSIAGADLFNDGQITVAVGQYAGGITLYRKTQAVYAALSENDLKRSVKVYPNPASTHFYVELPGMFNFERDIQISLVNLYGAGQGVAINKSGNTFKIDTENLPAGIYFVELRSHKVRLTQKIIITK